MNSRLRFRALPLALALLLVLAGCSIGSDAGGAGGGANGGGNASSGATEVTTGGGGTGGGSGDEAAVVGGPGDVPQVGAQPRALVRTGRVSLTVGNVRATQRNLTGLIRRSGGFVSDSRVRREQWDGETRVTGRLVVRVPAENFSTVFARVERAGRVRAANTSTEDVSERLVDLDARLESLRTQRERLRGLYSRANDTEGLLAIQERLSAVQSRIERLEGRRQSLERQVALSTIVIDLAEPAPEPNARNDWYETGFVVAFLDSVSGVGVVLRAALVGSAYLLPYLLVFGIPAGLLVYVIRFRNR